MNMSYEAGLILLSISIIVIFFGLLGILILTLDGKLWAKIDRVVNLIVIERQELIKKIEQILGRIEKLEKELKK